MFICRILLLESGDEFKVIGDYPGLRLQVLPIEQKYILFKPTPSKYILTLVEAVLPVVDVQRGEGSEFYIRLRITKSGPKFVNIVDLGTTPTP